MRLADCEITHRHIRGHNVAFVFGARAISDEEARGLAEEWTEVYGPIALPGYVSPQGWQSLTPIELGPIAARLKVDELAQVIELDGVKMSAELLTSLSTPTPEGFAFRVLQTKDGVSTMGRVDLGALQKAAADAAVKASKKASEKVDKAQPPGAPAEGGAPASVAATNAGEG